MLERIGGIVGLSTASGVSVSIGKKHNLKEGKNNQRDISIAV